MWRRAPPTPRSTGSPGSRRTSGCMVNTKVAGTSDEMVTLMKTGQYDGVSASGDATLRLIQANDVVPVNTALIPNYADVFAGLKGKAHNTVNGKSYGVPHGRGANLLMYRTDKVSPAPDSWGVVWDEKSQVQGQGHGLRQPDLHRRRRPLSEGDPAGPRDHQRLRARPEAVRRRHRPAEEAAHRHRRVLVRLHEVAARRSRRATRWSARPGRSSPTCSRPRRSRSRPRCPRRARPAGPTPG